MKVDWNLMRRMPSRCVLSWAVGLLAVGGAIGQANQEKTATKDAQEKLTLRGCLGRTAEYFALATDSNERWFLLTGNTSEFDKYVDREVILEGTRGEDISQTDYYERFPSFRVERLVRVVPKADAALGKSFSERAGWRKERNKDYGVQFLHPAEMTLEHDSNLRVGSNFATQEGAELASVYDIPATAYANANFRGGSFTIFVNRQITNNASCEQFGQLGPRGEDPTAFRVGNLQYARAEGRGAAMGSWESDYYFHIFRHGMCFEFGFELHEYSARNADTGCNVPLLTGEDEMNLIGPLLRSVSFFAPAIKPYTAADLSVVPEVTEFAASSDTADDVANRGMIKFSWATKGADYVEFAYSCDDPEEAGDGGVSSVVISENGPNRYCQNLPSFAQFSSGHYYHSPHGSADLGFAFFNHEDATSLVVTLTPFAHGIAFPASSKSLRVTIDPYNPFQRGVPTETRNMTIVYDPEGQGRNGYTQGSQLTISWTDERTQDPCVNLYLVQDDPAGGEKFILQLNLTRQTGCLRPARRGSYTWTVTTKHVGSNFRILAMTPGGFSGTLGQPFDIVRPATGLPE